MYPGKIIKLSTGLTLPMQYELSSGQGRMTAQNPKTGENFDGTYTAIAETKVTQFSHTNFWGTKKDQQAVEVSNVVPGSVVLVGDKGTVIKFDIKVQPGNRYRLPIGYGEGEDNHGKKYHLQF